MSEDADQQRDLQAAAVLRERDAEVLDDQRRGQREDHAVHAVEAPAETVGDGDVPVRSGQPRRIAGRAKRGGTFPVALLQRADDVGRSQRLRTRSWPVPSVRA